MSIEETDSTASDGMSNFLPMRRKVTSRKRYKMLHVQETITY